MTGGGVAGAGATAGHAGAAGSSAGAAGNSAGAAGNSAGAAGNAGTGGAAGASAGAAGSNSSGAVLRFIALGDGGEGNTTQTKVAQVAKDVCESKGGCSFAIYLGDNIYDSGVSGIDDLQFKAKFEEPYSILPFHFYVVLGNHDYGGNGAGYEFWKAQAQVDYTMVSTKWTMPDKFYKFSTPLDAGPAGGPIATFFALDTNAVMYGDDEDQRDWLKTESEGAPPGWKFALGHHPYVSNGQHGNAGEYEGIPGIPIVSGKNVKEFFEDVVCDKVDVYFSGHDHNRQWLEPTCGTEFIVSGTAAKTTGLKDRGTPKFFEKDQKGGFLLVELTIAELKGTFYDEDGVEEFTRTVGK